MPRKEKKIKEVMCIHDRRHKEFNPDVLRMTKIKDKDSKYILECVQCFSFVEV